MSDEKGRATMFDDWDLKPKERARQLQGKVFELEAQNAGLNACDYTAICTPGSGKDCARVAGKPNAGCLCPCHPDGLEREKPEDWKPDPIHAEALKLLEDLGTRHRLEACDPGGECYFPRCLADGCEAVDSDACLIDVALTDAPDAPGFGGRR